METSQSCPECGATVPFHEGFLTWCHQCSWNLIAPTAPKPKTRFDRAYAAAGRRIGNRMADRLLAADSLEPRLTPTRAAAYAIAVLTHATTLAFAVGGVALVVLAFPNPAAIVAGVLLVGVAYLMRPRLGKLPTERTVGRADAPALYALVDSVADALEVPTVDVIVLDHHFNASWAVPGLRRRRVLTLGLPLLAMLGHEERVALIGHELAHARNGDAQRGFVVGSAVDALVEFYRAIGPEHFGGAREWSELAFFERLVNLFLWFVSRPVLGVLLLELHLLLRDSQRAEYYADALAARVAGTRAAIGLEEQMLLESTFRFAVQHTAHARNGADLFAELERAVSGVPERERERRRRVARLEDARLDDTHPPTAKRLALLESREPVDAAVVCSEEQAEAIDAELSAHRESVQAALLDDYRDSLYAR
jgi:Zn-dependent protease with chaperone function